MTEQTNNASVNSEEAIDSLVGKLSSMINALATDLKTAIIQNRALKQHIMSQNELIKNNNIDTTTSTNKEVLVDEKVIIEDQIEEDIPIDVIK